MTLGQNPSPETPGARTPGAPELQQERGRLRSEVRRQGLFTEVQTEKIRQAAGPAVLTLLGAMIMDDILSDLRSGKSSEIPGEETPDQNAKAPGSAVTSTAAPTVSAVKPVEEEEAESEADKDVDRGEWEEVNTRSNAEKRGDAEPKIESMRRTERKTKEKPEGWRHLKKLKIDIDTANLTTPQALLSAMKAYEGLDYQWGGSGLSGGIDCSGLIVMALTRQLDVVYGDMTAEGMYDHLVDRKEVGKDQPEIGDLVFWLPKNRKPEDRRVKHVAVINHVYEDGRIRVTQSSVSQGYSETAKFDLKKGTADCELAFGRPVFFSQERMLARINEIEENEST